MSVEKAKKPRGLGRGLNALFEDEENFAGAGPAKEQPKEQGASPAAAPAQTAPQGPSKNRSMVSIDLLDRNESQPRIDFNEDAIEQLAASIKEHGILQPILVRPGKAGQYQIVAGERRWRAAQIAQLHEVPVHIVELDDEETLEVALVENLQREDLNPVEEALGYQRLLNAHNRTQEEIAKVIGKSRSHIANTVRLLELPEEVLDFMRQGKLSAGHARALIGSANAVAMAKEFIEKKMNVRQAETQAAKSRGGNRNLGKNKYQKDVDTVALENDMTNLLGMKVSIDSKDGKSGALRVEFKSLDQLDELMHRLSKFPKVMMAE